MLERLPGAWNYLIYGTIPKIKYKEMTKEEWDYKHRPDPVFEAIAENSKRYFDELRVKQQIARGWKSVLDSPEDFIG